MKQLSTQGREKAQRVLFAESRQCSLRTVDVAAIMGVSRQMVTSWWRAVGAIAPGVNWGSIMSDHSARRARRAVKVLRAMRREGHFPWTTREGLAATVAEAVRRIEAEP